MDAPPIIPLNGRVLIEELPFKPSKVIECVSVDKADRTEGTVVALSPFRMGRKKIKGGWEHNGIMMEHEVAVGDRVIFPGKYQDDDLVEVNRKRYRCIDSWDLVAKIEKPQPEGWEDPLTGEVKPDEHPIHIFGA